MRIDREDFEEAVRKYSDAMLRCAYAYCQSTADAEDIVQKAFVKYLETFPNFKNEDHRRAWLLRVVINLSKNHLNSFWNRNRCELDETLPDNNNPAESSEIWLAVRQLPPKYRIVIELYYREGFTIEEIAGITKAKRSTIGDRLKKAKELLREIYKEE